MDPKELLYTKSHEWAALDGDVCTVGITQFAVEQLTDVVYIEYKKAAGESVNAEDEFGEIESVKAVSPLYSPVAGEVIEVNTPLADDPAPVGEDPYGKGWMIKIKVPAGTTLDSLMTLQQYEEQIASEEH